MIIVLPRAAFTPMHESHPDCYGIQRYISKNGLDLSFRPFLARYIKHSPVSYPPRPPRRPISTHLSTLPPYFLHLSWLQATRTSPTPHLTRACGPSLGECPRQKLPRAQPQPRKSLLPAPARFTSTSMNFVEPKAPTCLQM